MRTYRLTNSRTIRLVEGDITQVKVDAIANAANAHLAGGGGVDGAIHRAGGPSIMQQLDEMRPSVAPLPAGQAVVTSAGNLPARFVLHAVGPIYRDGRFGEPEALASCYRRCLELAEKVGAGSISFPAISTGVYGYPPLEAAAIAIDTVIDSLTRTAAIVHEVTFVQFGVKAYELYLQLLDDNTTIEPVP